MMFISGLAELLTISSVFPFLTAIINPDVLLDYPIIVNTLEYFNLNNSENFLFIMSCFFCLAVLFSCIIRILILWFNHKWSYELAADLVIRVFNKSLYHDYLTHISRNSSEMVSAISHKTSNLVPALVVPSLNIIQLMILSLSILSGLVILLPTEFLIAVLSMGVFYSMIALSVRSKLTRTSEMISRNQIQTIKVLQESLEGIKEIILGNYYQHFIDEFSKAERPYRRGYGLNAFLIISPRFLIEAMGVSLIVALAYWSFASSDNPSSTLPSIGILVLAIQRLLPYIQQIYQAYGSIKANSKMNQEAIDLLIEIKRDRSNIHKENQQLEFENLIKLNKVNFSYGSRQSFALQNINLEIRKGDRVGIIGSTGSGKSTLIDFMMGLLPFNPGEIIIDDYALDKNSVALWQEKIIHVPQNIFLADTSIKNNIAFGEDENLVSDKRIKASMKAAFLDQFIDTLPHGLETNVGEKGLKLSGGQRQRIGIARALYKGGQVLILDEATNSLDMETEKNIVKTINGLDKNITLITIAHNLSTVKGCDRLVVMEQGKIIAQGDYKTISESNEFKKISGDLLD